MRYPRRISCEDNAYILQDILAGYLELYPISSQEIRSAAVKFLVGTRCSTVALHPAYRSRLSPGFGSTVSVL